MSDNVKNNVKLKKLQKKKQLVSWLGAGVKVRNLQTLENLAAKDLNRRNDKDLEGNNVAQDNSFLMSEISNFSSIQSDYVKVSQSNLQLNMMCRSSVLVLVQDNNASLNVPSGFVQNRLAPPNTQNLSKTGILDMQINQKNNCSNIAFEN